MKTLINDLLGLCNISLYLNLRLDIIFDSGDRNMALGSSFSDLKGCLTLKSFSEHSIPALDIVLLFTFT